MAADESLNPSRVQVPKKVMFYWANEKMSWLRYMTLYSFRKFNPDWKVELYLTPQNDIRKKVWKDNNLQDFFTYGGEDYSDRIKGLDVEIREWELYHPDEPDNDEWARTTSASHKSNFFKWSKLAYEGGIYCDLDILFVRPMDSFYEEIKDYDVSICHTRPGNYFSIGVLGGSGKSSFYHDVFLNGFKTLKSTGYQSAGVNNIYNLLGSAGRKPDYWKALVTKYGEQDKIMKFAFARFYPFGGSHVPRLFTQRNGKVSKGSIGIHWYAGHPTAQSFNKKLTEENYRTMNCTFGDWLEYVMGDREEPEK